jgi:RHS repeat-associated protein
MFAFYAGWISTSTFYSQKAISMGIRAGRWLLLTGISLCIAGLWACVAASAQGSPELGNTGGAPTESPLVIPQAEAFIGGSETQDAQEVRSANPEAVAAREESQTKYKGLGAGEVAELAGQLFPALVNELAGGPPKLPAGESITTYLTDSAAQVDLGGGVRGVIDSTVPMAIETSPGQRTPLDLSLRQSGSFFEPMMPLVRVRMPEHLGDGVQLADTGISLVPANGQGSALGGSEGSLVGGSVVYANTQVDADTLVKATTDGFEMSTMLRSVESPGQLSFRVVLPSEASLSQQEVGGAVCVVKEGATLAVISAPSARDAVGTAVPVSMGVSGGDTLTLTVDRSSADQYPIVVDPTVADSELDDNDPYPSNWREEPAPPSPFHFKEDLTGGQRLIDYDTSTPYVHGEWGAMAYETQGESHIYELSTETAASNAGNNIENKIFIRSSAGSVEKEEVLGASYANVKKELCVQAGCATGVVTGTNDNNAAEFKQTATNTGSAFESELKSAAVEILQEKAPSVTLNTTSATIEGEPNMFHTGTWVGPRSISEVTATDKGLGVYSIRATSPNKANWSESREYVWNCKGVQCPQSEKTGFTVHGTNYGYYELPNGEDTVEVKASDPAGLLTTVSGKVKVDYSLPYALALSGLPVNKELGEGSVKLKATAKDGTESFGGSGIESITLSIDGNQVGTASGSCAPGPCTATSGEWAVSGSEYPAGQHTAVITAKSPAGDKATAEYTFDTGHLAAPVALGPGSVSPETGEFFLNATDAPVASPGATLSVQRSYNSSHLTAGAEGPLGPQWAMSVGGAQSLTKAAEGAVVLTNAEGQQSVFTSKGAGEFNSPPLSASLKLTEVLEGGKTKEFQLKDGSGQITKFALPTGGTGNTWVPATLEGPGATNTVTYMFQTVGGITEPTEVLAPVPAGVSCTTSLVKGCRALGFVYSSTTTATGNAESEWGEYKGRLKEVTFTAWDRASAIMKTTTIADYVFDKEGELRGEWDPRISPKLETTYGYETSSGRVIAMTVPGQQPWLFNYGTASGDPRARVVSVTRPSALTAAGNGQPPVMKTAPALSTSHPSEGNTLSVSNGTWDNSPLSYSYQWNICYTEERAEGKFKICPPLGATSQTFTPTTSDKNHELYAVVTATNANGSTSAVSNTSALVATVAYWKKTSEFGSTGEGNSQFKNPWGIAVGEAEDVFVADSGNSRIEKFSSTGGFIKTFGKKGTKASEFNVPEGVATFNAAGEEKNLYIADSENNRIGIAGQKLESDANFGVAKSPGWVTAARTESGTYKEKLYVVNHTKSEIERYPMEFGSPFIGIEYEKFGKEGTGNGQFKAPAGIAVTEGGSIYIVDEGNNRVEQFNSLDVYVGQFGSKGSGNGQFSAPKGIALASNGFGTDIYVADSGNNRIEELNEAGEYVAQFPTGSGPQGIAFSKSRMYVTDGTANKVEVFEKTTTPNPAPQPPNPGGSAVTTVEYHVPVSGTGAPYAMGKTEVEAWGQKDDPTEATAIFPPDEPMGWPAKDYKRASIIYLDHSARAVNNIAPGGATSTAEYNSKNDVERTLSADNRATALKEGSKSAEKSKLLDTQNTYNTEGTELLGTLGPEHTVKLSSGSQVAARRHTQYSYNEGAPTEGGPYGLPTKITEGAQYAGKEEDMRESTMSYSGQGNLGWKLHEPTAVTSDPKGLKLTHTIAYEESTGAVKETITPAGSPSEKSAHGTETIYYSTAPNASIPACGEHAEWANLPCEIRPAKQPETSGFPELPVTKFTYTIFDEPEQAIETVGSETRTTTVTPDAAGRPKTSAVTSTVGTALPTVTYEYNLETGELEQLKTTIEGKIKTIKVVKNKLGEVTSYIDADENTATYSPDIDGRIGQINDGKGTQTFGYNATTGFLTELKDSAAGTFTATRDAEGNPLSVSYPNAMTANEAYNEAGAPTSLEYKKTAHCATSCPETWFAETVVPSIHGQWLEDTNTFSKTAYEYDAPGALTRAQNTPSGNGCTTRIYVLDPDRNRTSLKSYEPNSKGECATEKGTEEKHTYDPADVLTDPGAKYNAFGDTTALSASDAGGTELTNTLYVNHLLASETQNGETIGFNLDPAGRTRETVSTGKTSQDIIAHFAGSGDTPAWTVETPSGIWTRNIAGITGGLAAIQVNGTTPVLQLADLHGDIVATAALSETETKLLSSSEPSEFGVPTTSTPPKYSWLGAEGARTELPSGQIAMGARSYIPQLGRFLQPDPIPGGSADAYTYTFGDPINTTDPSGALTYGFSGWLKEANNQEAQEVVAREVARETLEREEAERRAAEAQAAAEAAGPIGEESTPLGGYAGWLCETAANTGQEVEGCDTAGRYGGGSLATLIRNNETGLISWVNKHVVQPVKHFVHKVVKTVKEVFENPPKCYPNEIEGGGQCSSAPPGGPGNPFFPFPEP